MIKTAVVILNWNGVKLLEQFLPSVIQYTLSDDVEIIVADNCSTDNSIDFLKETYPQIRRIVLPENYGYADGYNQSLKQIEAKYFVLLNSDVEVGEGWLQPIVDFLDVNEDVVAAQPKLLAQRNKSYFEYAGAAGGFLDKYGYPFCRGRIFGEVEQDKGQYDTVTDVLWATGACMVIRTQNFFDAGGFDATFFAHMEEIDLCWRLNSRGKRIVCIPSSVVYHVGGATLSEESPRKTFLNFRNNLLMLYKNLPEDSIDRVLNKRIFLDYIAALKYALTGKMPNAKAVHAAHKEFKQIKQSYTLARKENLEKATQSSLKTIYPKSILADFYFRGNKFFSRLRKFC